MRMQSLLAATLFSILPPVADAQDQPSVWEAGNRGGTVRELRCRGGEGFEYRSLGIRQFPSGAKQIAIALTFAPSLRAAGSKSAGLEPGTCAWVEAPLGAGEPREVHFITQTFAQWGIGPINTSLTAAERYPDVQAIAAYLAYPGHYWSFLTRETNGPYLDASHHRYWVDRSAQALPAPPLPQHKPGGTGGWVVHAGYSGGIDGRVVRITVDANGRMQASHSRTKAQCSVDISDDKVRSIEAMIARSRPEQWQKSYYAKGEGCCDLFGASLTLEREDTAQKRVVFETGWLSPVNDHKLT
jgi:hypothetical protein